MPIFRWIIIGLAIWLVVVILRQMIGTRRQKSAAKKSPPASAYTAMVSCHHCNLHIPQAEAIQEGDRYYCCIEHRDAEQKSE